MEYFGYAGQILQVDLTTGNAKERALDPELARQYIGDFGISARLAYDLIKPGTDPLSPENAIIVGAGPLAGTTAPQTSRTALFTKWPMTGTIGPGGGSGGFSGNLKYAGYDELVITGKADKPVYLMVSDQGAELLDAGDLWGRDIFEATDEIWKRHGPQYGVICIGQAGENQAKISMALVNKTASIGRFGLGAVMGFKNLKCIVVGGKKGVRVPDWPRFNELVDQCTEDLLSWPFREYFVKRGFALKISDRGVWDFESFHRKMGLTNYYTEFKDIPDMKERFGDEMIDRARRTTMACPSCCIACRGIERVELGSEECLTYRSVTPVDTFYQLQLDGLASLDRLDDSLQRYGVDRWSFCGGAQLLLHLNKLGIIAKDALEGIEMGNEKALTKLIRKIAFREGIGDALADGREGIARRFGKEAVEKYGCYVKGADLQFDARLSKLASQQIDLVVSPMGPTAGKEGSTPAKRSFTAPPEAFRDYARLIGMPAEDQDRIFGTPFKVNVARFLKHSQHYFTAFACLGMCFRTEITQYYSMERLAQLYSTATGIEMNGRELKRAAERVWNLVKMLNVREGFSRKDDRFPRQWLEPINYGGKAVRLMDYFETRVLTEQDLEGLLDDYYDEMGWDTKTGIPTRQKLSELGLDFTTPDLANRG